MDDEKLIKIIISLDKISDDYMCICTDDYLINELEHTLYQTFKNTDEITNNIIKKISCLDNKNIFTNSEYFTDSFENNKLRIKISDNILPNNDTLYFDYSLIYKYIKYDYHLIKYCNIKKLSSIKIKNLISKNYEILRYINSNNINIFMLTELIKCNYMISTVIDDCILLNETNDCEIDISKHSFIYMNINKILGNKKLHKLFIRGLKRYVQIDKFNYIHLSKHSRNNIELAKTILEIDPKFIAYTMSNIKKDKNIMLYMLKIDKENRYYLDDSLKNDKDILSIT